MKHSACLLATIATFTLVFSAHAHADEKAASGKPLQLMGHRFFTLNTVVRVRQIEVTRDQAHGPDESSVHSPRDIAGFTAIVERMAPVQVMQMLNDYFAAVLEPIRRHGGIVNQFQGDAMLVTFNVPVEDARHADQAVRSAIEIQATVAERRFAGERLHTRIGINTGTVVAGIVGAGDRLHYTVHGDTVNVAARLEALNKTYGTDTLISGETVAILRDGLRLERLDDADIRGKDLPVTVYRLPAGVRPRQAH